MEIQLIVCTNLFKEPSKQKLEDFAMESCPAKKKFLMMTCLAGIHSCLVIFNLYDTEC